MNLNREEINKKVEELKKKAEEKGAVIILNPEYIYENRQDCYWYGGSIGQIKYRGVTVSISVRGDVVCTLYNMNQDEVERVKDKGNNGSFYDRMSSYIKNDEELDKYITNDYLTDELIEEHKEAGNKYVLCMDNNNWLEFDVINDETNEYIDELPIYNIIDNDDVLDAFDNVEYYTDAIDLCLKECYV